MKILVDTGRKHFVTPNVVRLGTFENPHYERRSIPVLEEKRLPSYGDFCKYCRLNRAAHPKAQMHLKAPNRGASCEIHWLRHQKRRERLEFAKEEFQKAINDHLSRQ